MNTKHKFAIVAALVFAAIASRAAHADKWYIDDRILASPLVSPIPAQAQPPPQDDLPCLPEAICVTP